MNSTFSINFIYVTQARHYVFVQKLNNIISHQKHRCFFNWFFTFIFFLSTFKLSKAKSKACPAPNKPQPSRELFCIISSVEHETPLDVKRRRRQNRKKNRFFCFHLINFFCTVCLYSSETFALGKNNCIA